MFLMIEKTITLIQYVFWCSILFYVLWNTVWFSVEQNIEHIHSSIINTAREISTQEIMWPPFFCSSIMMLISSSILRSDSPMIMVPLILNANLISLGITVTLLACTANKFTSSKRPTIKFSAAT